MGFSLVPVSQLLHACFSILEADDYCPTALGIGARQDAGFFCILMSVAPLHTLQHTYLSIYPAVPSISLSMPDKPQMWKQAVSGLRSQAHYSSRSSYFINS